MKKLTRRSLLGCLINGNSRSSVISIKGVTDMTTKLQLCATAINAVARCHLLRKEYLNVQRRKFNQFKIVNWVKTRLFYKKFQR